MRWLSSDTHGSYFSLKKLVEEVDKIDPNHSWLFMGDYIDRNRNSFETVEFLIALAEKRNCIFLRGNHDDVFYYITCGGDPITDIGYYAGEKSQSAAARWLMKHGFLATRESYAANGFDIGPNSDLPVSHRKFFENLQLIHVDESWFATHAYYPPQLEVPRESRFLRSEIRQDLLWSRFTENELNRPTNWNDLRLFVGHTPTVNYHGVHEPLHTVNVSLLDCGSFIPGGALSAHCPETGQFIICSTLKEDILTS